MTTALIKSISHFSHQKKGNLYTPDGKEIYRWFFFSQFRSLPHNHPMRTPIQGIVTITSLAPNDRRGRAERVLPVARWGYLWRYHPSTPWLKIREISLFPPTLLSPTPENVRHRPFPLTFPLSPLAFMADLTTFLLCRERLLCQTHQLSSLFYDEWGKHSNSGR